MNAQKLPTEIVEKWPEVFTGLEVRAVPLEYLESLRIIFKNGTEWELLRSSIEKCGVDEMSGHLEEFLASYVEVIKTIEFELDIKKIKKDCTKITNRLLKKIK